MTQDEIETRRADQKRRLAEYAAQLEVGKRQRADDSSPRSRAGGAEEKALELLLEGAVHITAARPGWVEALVVGDTGPHHVWWSDLASWNCDCEAARFRGSCSHILAVRRVVRLTTTTEEEPF